MSLRDWFTANELARMALPGIPSTKRGVNMLADREGWVRQERAGQGGGFEYHRGNLPLAARKALDEIMARELLDAIANTNAVPQQPGADRRSASTSAAGSEVDADPAASSRRESLWRAFDRKPQKAKDEAKRRLGILQSIARLIEDGRPKVKAIDIVATATKESPATLRRWRAEVRDLAPCDWLAALAPAYVGKVDKVEIDMEGWDLFKADYLRQGEPSAQSCYDRVNATIAPRGIKLPSLKTLMRRLEAEVGPVAIEYARKGSEALRRAYPDQERDHSTVKALELVVADGHKLDIRVQLGKETVGRIALVAWQDVHSGKLLAWRLGETETSELVRLSFADLVERFGIPDGALLDNGRAFAAKTITGGTSTRYRFTIKPEDPHGVLTALNVKVTWATPYHGQAKPIERAFRDLAERISKHPAFDGAYTGNSTANKPENYGSKAVSMAEVEAIVGQEIIAHNARLGRTSRVAAGRSFDQAFEESFNSTSNFIRQATPEQKRLLLLAAEGVRSSTEDGSIRLYGNRYWSDDVGVARVRGQKLMVRFDPQRLDKDVHLYTLDGRFIASMQVIEMAGFTDVNAAKEHLRARRDWGKGIKLQLDAERRLSAADVAARLPGAPDEPEISAPKLVRPHFPKRTRKAAGETMPKAERDDVFLSFVEGQQKLRGAL